MAEFRLPPDMPGTITWQSKMTGISPYMLASAASSQPGHAGYQGRYYMAQLMHHRLRAAAVAAQSQNQAPTA